MKETSRPSDPVDFEIFTGDGFQNFLTGLSNFSPGSNIKTIMADVKKRPGMDKVAGDFPAGIFSHRGFPRWVLFLPGWEPAGHLAGTYLTKPLNTSFSPNTKLWKS